MNTRFITRLCIAIALICYVLVGWPNYIATRQAKAYAQCSINHTNDVCHTLLE